jgi:hypothetical protein
MEYQPPVPPDDPSATPPAQEPPPYGPPPYAPPPMAAAAPAPLPWEQPGAPSLASFFATVRQLLFRPREAFAGMATSGSYARPVAFALVLGIAGVCVSAGYEVVLGDPMKGLWSHLGEGGGPDLPRFVIFLASVFSSPFVVAAVIGLSAVCYHVILALLRGSGGGFGGTFRVVCYCMAANVWAAVPFAGGLVAGVWMAVISILGLMAVHRTSAVKASLAVLLPYALCCACLAPLLLWRVMSHM